jgi:hypothetical protein
MRQWLLLKDLQDSIWNHRGMLRIEPGIIDSVQIKVVQSMLDSLPIGIKMDLKPSGIGGHVTDWFARGENRKRLAGLLSCFGYSEAAINGMAFVERLPEMETLQKLKLIEESRRERLYSLLAEEQARQELPKPANDDQTKPARVVIGRSEDEGPGDRSEVQSEDQANYTEQAAEVAHHDEDSAKLGEEAANPDSTEAGCERPDEEEAA